MSEKSVFETLNAIDVNEHKEEKNGLSYLSWSWSWAELKKKYPDATYSVERFGENKIPYIYDENTGYMVFTTVTIQDHTHEMWLPVMDTANKAMLDKQYTYDGKYWDKQKKCWVPTKKTVQKATMFDINKTIMRCLVKNIGMFGLGLYIYSGEDLPEVTESIQIARTNEDKSVIENIKACINSLIDEFGVDVMSDGFQAIMKRAIKYNTLVIDELPTDKLKCYADELLKALNNKRNRAKEQANVTQ